ncbi:AAA family ATPase [Tateyamaria sp. SN3-11]|uniref:AAA family ATPase n=1 Tax=Tateyamaria sp. SN3-11 TaxID=3092147 RepID=UPI0039EB6BCF
MPRRILITGCSGGGKSTLIDALAEQGYATVPEPGRRIVAEGRALPWVDPAAFARRAVEMARADLEKVRADITFFDRGLIDAAVALAHSGGAPIAQTLGATRPYDRTVFLAPPWPDIYRQDAQRRHDLRAATEEYDRLTTALTTLGYYAVLLPKVPVQDRLAFVLAHIADA